MATGLEDKYIIKDNKKLRFGYTTGSCAAAAAQAAARMLFSGEAVAAVRLTTPKGITLFLEPVDAKWNAEEASCAIKKDAGDDPDVTDGLYVYARVKKCALDEIAGQKRRIDFSYAMESENEISENGAGKALENPDSVRVSIRGGAGIGTVTLPGLEQPVGAPAINRVPQQMIREEVGKVCEEYGYHGGLTVEISAPGGEEIAKKTFNLRLGIEGGISILGTSGIVEPMSEQALLATIELELRQKSADRRVLVVTPGNYGAEYLRGHFPCQSEDAVKCSNYVGQTIDLAVNLGIKGLLFVAHIGKFVKIAGGIMNTHSREADARMEILAACALRAGADAEHAREILAAVTTDEGLRVIRDAGVWDAVMQILVEKIGYHLQRRAQGRMTVGAIVFSNVYGELGRTRHVEELLEKLRVEE